MKGSCNVDMTEGNILKKIFIFTVPIFFGQLFQQMYTSCDSLIVSNLIGPEALAAIGATESVIWMLIGLANGTSAGAGIVVAKYIGAKDDEGVSRSVHTITAIGLITGIILTLVGTLFTRQILKAAGVPEDIMEISASYLGTYFAGSVFFVMYNIFSGILHASGDSRHPLIYLITASVTNIFLDLFFIGVLHMGVGGAALATAASQGLSAVLSAILLMRTKESWRLVPRKLAIHRYQMKEIVKYGLPSGFQSSIDGFSNVIGQYFVNMFGTTIIAASLAYDKLFGPVILPTTCLCLAIPPFIGQNLGAKQFDRAREGARLAIKASLICSGVLSLVLLIFTRQFMSLFSRDPEIIQFGIRKSWLITPSLVVMAHMNTMAAVLRGTGRSFQVMIVYIAIAFFMKVIYLFITTPIFMNIFVLYAIFPIEWLVEALIFRRMLKKVDWTKSLQN